MLHQLPCRLWRIATIWRWCYAILGIVRDRPHPQMGRHTYNPTNSNQSTRGKKEAEKTVMILARSHGTYNVFDQPLETAVHSIIYGVRFQLLYLVLPGTLAIADCNALPHPGLPNAHSDLAMCDDSGELHPSTALNRVEQQAFNKR